MADLKVITNPTYRNYSTQPRKYLHLYEVREDEGSYSGNTEDLLEKMKTLLGMPLWPEFEDGVYLKPEEAAQLYRLAHGVQGLIHILDRSVHLSGIAKDYEEASGVWFTEFQISQVWCGLIELARHLTAVSEKTLDTPDEKTGSRH